MAKATKRSAAQILGSLGGKARARALSAKRRQAIARKGWEAMQKKRKGARG